MKKLFFISMLLLFAGFAFAQTNAPFHGIQVVDETGVRVTTITSVEIYAPDTTTDAVIFSDRGLQNTIEIPMTEATTNTTLVDGVFHWYGPDGYDFSITDGTNIRTNANHRTRTATEGTLVFPSYLSNLTTSQYLDAESITFGTSSDWVVNGGNVADLLQWTPASDDATFNIGTSGTTLNSNFNVFTGSSLGFKLSSSAATHSMTYDGGIVNLNVTSDFATNINTGTSTGAVSIGNSASGAWVIDGASTGSITSNGAMGIQTSDAQADIDIDAAAGSVIVDGGEAIANAVVITAPAGGVDISAAATFDIDITATGGTIILTASENAQSAIHLEENGGASGSINLYANQGTGASATTEHDASIQLHSDAGGISLYTTGNVANAIRIETNAGTTEEININAVQGSISIKAGENAANALLLSVDGDTASTLEIFNDTGTSATKGAASIQLLSDVGGIALQSGLDGVGITLLADAGTSESILIHSDQGTGVGSVTIDSDDGGITFNTGVGAGDGITYNGRTDSLFIIEGTANGFETSVTFTDPTTQATINFPDPGDEGAAGADIVWVADAGTTTVTGTTDIPLTDAIVAGTSSGGSDAWALKDGEEGQILSVVIVSDGGQATITPETCAGCGWATVVLTDVIDQVSFLYVDDTVGWMILGTSSDGSGIVAVTQ